MGTPVWNRDGILCCANAHAHVVKVTFLKGAKLKDPRRVFNAELEGNARRAINSSQGDTLDVEGIRGLVRDAIALNREKPAARKAGGASSVSAKAPRAMRKPAPKSPKKKRAARKS